MNNLATTLEQRHAKYGSYQNNARVTQAIMDILMTGENAQALSAAHKETLHMVAHKMSRIVNGDPMYEDSWFDIAGYAQRMLEIIQSISPNVPKKELKTIGGVGRFGNPDEAIV